MNITCISDLHGHYPELEGGDLLIVAGDLTGGDELFQYEEFYDWALSQDYKKVVVIAGNHDNYLQKNKDILFSEYYGFEYLCDSATKFDGLKIWGSPWTPWFDGVNPNCKAFMIKESKLAAKWALIPDDIDILITHCPPFGIMDLVERKKENVGSAALLGKVLTIKPKLHVFGHIHHGYGMIRLKHDLHRDTICVNASIMDEVYDPVNKPIRVIL